MLFMLKIPIIIINFKAYDSAIGKNAVKLAKICEKVAKKRKKSVAVSVSETDIAEVSKAVSIPVLAQHIDPDEPGAHTGAILAEEIKAVGAVGTLLNHSEKRIPHDILEKTIEHAKKAKLITIVCAKDNKEAALIKKFKPDFIAVEPPELIGGTISVSSAKPGVIKASKQALKGSRSKLIVGAGVHTTEDVKKSIELGAVGVLLASGVTKAKNPEQVLEDLAKGL